MRVRVPTPTNGSALHVEPGPRAKALAAWTAWAKAVVGAIVGALLVAVTAAWGLRGYADDLARQEDVAAARVATAKAVSEHAATPAHPGSAAQLGDHEARLRVLEALALGNATDHAWIRDSLTLLLGERRLPVPHYTPAPPVERLEP